MNDSRSTRDRRIGAASSLVDDIAALDRLRNDTRAGLIHDSLISAIDTICLIHKGEGPAIFNKKQVEVLKEISFQIVYALDQRNHPPRNWLKRAWISFSEASLGTKAEVIGAGIAVGGAIVGATMFVYPYIWHNDSSPAKPAISVPQGRTTQDNSPENSVPHMPPSKKQTEIDPHKPLNILIPK